MRRLFDVELALDPPRSDPLLSLATSLPLLPSASFFLHRIVYLRSLLHSHHLIISSPSLPASQFFLHFLPLTNSYPTSLQFNHPSLRLWFHPLHTHVFSFPSSLRLSFPSRRFPSASTGTGLAMLDDFK